VAGALVASGLAGPATGSWPRIVVEKPFGSDLASAIALERALRPGFSEERIYRIDHYLARETVQNAMLLRFANGAFEPLWDREHVERVEILAAETLGVEGRGATYDRAGVVRDMFQSHLMQLLALVASDPPARFTAGAVQDEKVRLFRSLRPFPANDLAGNLVLGQYAGYRKEAGVRPDSPIPTFARLRVFIDNPRWQGVPFFLTSGKRLREKRIEITLFFRPSSLHLFSGPVANSLALNIHPREGVTLRFSAKEPGAELRLRPAAMEFDYTQGFDGPFLEPYEKALLDVMAGDHLLFWRQDGVELSWGYLDSILEACERCVPSPELHPYRAGSDGPAEAKRLV
jgi:glucose-6-phosphate 1-dehydrogenase